MLTEALSASLIEVWAAVVEAGGAVGFLRPVDEGEIDRTATAAFERVVSGLDDLVMASEDDRLLAFGFLVSNEWALTRHWASIRRLQRHPSARGRGVGARVLAALEECARERGLERVCLSVRGGTGREAFYLRHGYALEAVLPDRLRLAEGVTVDELHLSKPLRQEGSGLALPVRRLDEGLPLPRYAHAGDAGLDLQARSDVTLEPGERAAVATGLAIALPAGYVGLVHPRSGLAARHGLSMVNAPGTVDAGYRGELTVLLINLDASEPISLARGDRIAQLVIQRVETVRPVEVTELPPSARGEGGFGSSGR